ncbi:hypothetical protein THAOC_06354, partial [Thalassiosira oceanica]
MWGQTRQRGRDPRVLRPDLGRELGREVKAFVICEPEDSKRRKMPASTMMSTMENPQPFEVALIRKLKSKTKSVRDAFLLLDADGDGHISPDDIRTVTHNELGITLTSDQMKILASRNEDDGGRGGMKYKEFAIYFDAVSRS